MKRASKIAILVVVMCVVLSVLDQRSLRFLQNIFGIPGEEVVVGYAVIQKPTEWLLVDMRREDGRKMTYGFIPCVFDDGCNNKQKLPFFLFSAADDYISLTGIKDSLRETLDAGGDLLDAGMKREKIDGFDAYSKYYSSGAMKKHSKQIIIPDLGITIAIESDEKSGLVELERSIKLRSRGAL